MRSPGWVFVALPLLFACVAVSGAPALTVNVTHDSVTDLIPGAAVTYVIDVASSLDGMRSVRVTDTMPRGFVFVGTTCSARGNAVCSVFTPSPAAVTGVAQIGTNGAISIRLVGYFTEPGAKTHVVSATDMSGGSGPAETAVSHDSVFVGVAPLSAQVESVLCTTSWDPCVTTVDGAWDVPTHYIVRVTNTSAKDLFLAGIARFGQVGETVESWPSSGDFLLLPSLAWSLTNLTCSSIRGGSCVEISNSSIVGGPSVNIAFAYPEGSVGYLPAGGGFQLEFDLKTSAEGCGFPTTRTYGWFTVGFGDSSLGLGKSSTDRVVTNLPSISRTPCFPFHPIPTLATDLQQNPANPVNWNVPTPVMYRVTLSNASDNSLSNVPVASQLTRNPGTSAFTATVNSGPTCVSGCPSPLTSVRFGDEPTIEITNAAWSAILPALGPHQSAVIEYTITYTPVACETDPRPSGVEQTVVTGDWASPGGAVTSTTAFVEAPACLLDVKVSTVSTGPIQFERPYEYEIVYRNLSASPVRLKYLETLVSVSSTRYVQLSLPVDQSRSCTVTQGEVSYAGSTEGAVRSEGAPAVYFGGLSTLTCRVSLIAHQPFARSTWTKPLCQGAGQPQLVVAAYMDSTDRYLPTTESMGVYSEVRTDLPLCRNVIVSKTASVHQARREESVVYQITVENRGDDPVSSFTVSDVVEPPLAPVSVGPCRPTAACISGPSLTGNVVHVAYGALERNQPVSFDLTVKAPPERGTFSNVAQGAFLPGGNFYFYDDEANFLQQEEHIQVDAARADLSIALSGPPTATPGGRIEYSIRVTNHGPDDATRVAVESPLPPGVRFISAQPAQGICQQTPRVLCRLDLLPAGASADITVTGSVQAASGTITTRATVSSPDIVGDDPENNSSMTSAAALPAEIDDVPTLGVWMLCALAALLAFIAVLKL